MQRSLRRLVAQTRHWTSYQQNLYPRAVRAFASTEQARRGKLRSAHHASNDVTPFDRFEFDRSIRKNLFYIPSFDLYQGSGSTETKGLYDYGPPGCALQGNIVDAWRKHFVLEEEMLEVDCVSLTPHEILKASGHVDKFTDWVCRDSTTGESFRADHLVAEVVKSRLRQDKLVDSLAQEYQNILSRLESCTGPELGDLITKHKICSPTTGESLEPPTAFNLMFETSIGPKNSVGRTSSAFLRPETAQGQFLNFQKLLSHNQQAMPFASASVGKCYRNEISPRSGLLRVREFLLAEIEHFMDPDGGKKHARFSEVADVKLNLLDREAQSSVDARGNSIDIAQAVSRRIVDNETLGYFLARIQLFLLKCGINPTKIRFRQHTDNEMAHYATDCWDAELLTSYGWIECVGCADRSAYDLTVHSKRSGRPLTVRQQLGNPREVEQYEIEINRKLFGPRFRDTGKAVEHTLLNLDQQRLQKLALELSSFGSIQIELANGDGNGRHTKIILEKNLVSIDKRSRIVNSREYTPNVVEPSFGIGRILYALLEHSWWMREDGRGVLSFPLAIAPVKVLVLPLSRHAALVPVARRLASRLRELGISNRLDDSSTSIGKRYSRGDELGTPLGVTIDFRSLKDHTYTLRDRDTLEQIRAGENEICSAIEQLVQGSESWSQVAARLPKFESQWSESAPSET